MGGAAKIGSPAAPDVLIFGMIVIALRAFAVFIVVLLGAACLFVMASLAFLMVMDTVFIGYPLIIVLGLVHSAAAIFANVVTLDVVFLVFIACRDMLFGLIFISAGFAVVVSGVRAFVVRLSFAGIAALLAIVVMTACVALYNQRLDMALGYDLMANRAFIRVLSGGDVLIRIRLRGVRIISMLVLADCAFAVYIGM